MKKLIIGIGLASSFLFANTPQLVDTSNLCYKSRMYPVEYNLLFDAMKKRFLDSNMHLKHMSKKDGFIEAEGTKAYDSELYRFTFTVNFRKLGDVNKISTLISYELVKKESQIKSVTEFNLPIPVPWDKAFKYEGYTNVIDPKFFDSFYLNFDKTLFDLQMRSMHIKVDKTKNKQLLEDLGEKVEIKKVKETNVTNNIKDLNATIIKEQNKTKVILNTKELNITKNIKEQNNTKSIVKKIIKTTKEVNTTKNKGNLWEHYLA